MADKLNLARIKKFGQNFEISVDPDLALKFKKGELDNLREVLHSDQIYSDAKKGQVVSPEKLVEAFKTDDPLKVAEIIIKEGEIQLTSEHRGKEREQKLKQLINKIHQMSVDPKTNLPHPANRIDAALEEAKIKLDEHKSLEEQFDDIISKLRPILPIKIEMKKMTITIPSLYAGKSYPIVTKQGKVISDDWLGDGSWRVVLEIPAGMQQDLIDTLNSLTKGEVLVE